MQIHLKTPVEISVNGQMEKSEFLNIEEPNRGNILDVAELKEIGSAALLSAKSMFSESDIKTSEKPEEATEGFDSDTALMMLKMGGKYKDAIVAFDKFLLKFGTFDDTKVQSGSLARMDLKDYENALGGYFGKHCFL